MRKVGRIGGSPKRLAINRRTVSRYVRQQRADGSKCTSAPIEPGRLDADSKCTTAPIGSAPAAEPAASNSCFRVRRTSRQSLCPLAGVYSGQARPGTLCRADSSRPARRAGYGGDQLRQRAAVPQATGSISGRCRFGGWNVSRARKRRSTSEPAPRITTPDGKRRKTHVFRMVLSHSRKGYSEACFRQTTEDFLRVLENAFWHFGGVPKTLVIDNLKAAVLHRRLVRSGAEPQAAIVRRALRHGDPADQATDAAAQGEDRAGRGVCAGQRPQRRTSSPRWRNRTSICSTGKRRSPTRGSTARRSNKSARCLAKSSGPRCCRCRPSGSPSSTKRSGSSAATATSKWPRRITQCRRSTWAHRVGPLGCAAGADLQSATGADRRACASAAGQIQHAGRASGGREDQRHRARSRLAVIESRELGRERPGVGRGDAESARHRRNPRVARTARAGQAALLRSH